MSLFPGTALWEQVFFGTYPRNSVYVISDSQLAEYKERQLQAEIAELDRLIDDHKQSIERLEKTKASLIQTSSASLSPSKDSALPDSNESKSAPE